MPFHKKCFQVAYPLPKIDLIAIADFAAGMLCGVYEYECLCHYVARGNGELGSGDIQRTCLLVDPVNTSQVTKQYVAALIHKFTLFDHGMGRDKCYYQTRINNNYTKDFCTALF